MYYKMYITKGTHVNADSIQILVCQHHLSSCKEVFRKEYCFGYDVSYKKEYATKEKPFIDDLIEDIQSKYNNPLIGTCDIEFDYRKEK